jgi:hypothetical protein
MSSDEKRFEPKKVTMKLEDGSHIRGGCINLYAEMDKKTGASFNRISDIFLHGESPFVVVSNCTFGGEENQVLVVNKGKIIWISPMD